MSSHLFNIKGVPIGADGSSDTPSFDSYGQIFDYNSRFFKPDGIWVETLREWLILTFSIGLSIYFIICVRRLRRTQRKLDLDQFLLIMETTKLLLFMVIEFFLFDIGALLLCISMQSYIRMIVCGNFLMKVLDLAGKGQYSVRAKWVYHSIFGVSLLVITVTAFFNYPIGATCTNNPGESWHWEAITIIDTIQTVLIFILAIIMIYKLKPLIQAEFRRNELLSNLRQYQRFELQVKVLAIFYLLVCFLDWLLHLYGKKEEIHNSIGCVKNKFIVVLDNKGAAYLLVFAFVEYIYALVIFGVFYWIPLKYGIVHVPDEGIKLIEEDDQFDTKKNKEQIIQEKQAKYLFQTLSDAEDFHNSQLSPKRLSSNVGSAISGEDQHLVPTVRKMSQAWLEQDQTLNGSKPNDQDVSKNSYLLVEENDPLDNQRQPNYALSQADCQNENPFAAQQRNPRQQATLVHSPQQTGRTLSGGRKTNFRQSNLYTQDTRGSIGMLDADKFI